MPNFKTNGECPHCGSPLYTADYEGNHPLFCKKCNEDMLFIENANIDVLPRLNPWDSHLDSPDST